MKKTIINMLCNGVYTGKKYDINDFLKKLYILRYIFEEGNGVTVCCKKNAFWDYENRKNREELILDLYKVHTFNITDIAYSNIVIRFEHGDAYGICQ